MKTLKLTDKELTHLVNVIDSISAMIGSNGAEQDAEWSKDVKALDKMLSTNGIKRKHN